MQKTKTYTFKFRAYAEHAAAPIIGQHQARAHIQIDASAQVAV